MTPDLTSAARERIAQQFISALPYAKALGLTLVRLGDGMAEILMPWNELLVGDPETGVIHGGAVFALMDTCAGTAVMSHASAPRRTATLDLRIDYMRAAVPDQAITAHAECYHVTRTVAFVQATATDGDDRPIATATGAFMIEPAP